MCVYVYRVRSSPFQPNLTAMRANRVLCWQNARVVYTAHRPHRGFAFGVKPVLACMLKTRCIRVGYYRGVYCFGRKKGNFGGETQVRYSHFDLIIFGNNFIIILRLYKFCATVYVSSSVIIEELERLKMLCHFYTCYMTNLYF